MKKLFKYLKKSLIFVILAPAFMFLEVFMDLMQPTLMAEVVDVGIASGDLKLVITLGLKMLLFAFLGFIGGAGCTVFAVIASTNFGTELRLDTFNKIQTFSFREIDKFKTSSLVTRLTNDVTQVQNMVLMILRGLVRSPLLCIGGLIMAFTLSFKLSLIFICAIPVLLISVIVIMKKSFPLFMSVQSKIDRVNTVMRENLLGVKVVKAFVGFAHEKLRFEKANKDLLEHSVKAQTMTILLWPIVTVIMNLSVVALLWFGGKLYMVGEIELGKIMAFMNYLTQILMSLMFLIMLTLNFSRAAASTERINEVLDEAPSIIEAKNPKSIEENFDIEFKNVCFKYNDDDEEDILKNISFSAKKGETIGIIGGTGSGKSTISLLLSRLYDVTKGEILIGGNNIKDIKISDLRDKIGIVMQDSILFEGTIRSNLKWGKEDCNEDEIKEALKSAACYDFVYDYDDTIDHRVEQRAKNCSGGQKQRLSIARTFIKNPKILLLDDSTSAVDMETEAKIQEALKTKNNDGITIIIAQRISSIMNADKIIVLNEGEIENIGSHSDLANKSGLYHDIVVSQLGEEAICNG